MALLIPPDGPSRPHRPANGRLYTLPEIHAALGGYMEVHRLHTGDFLLLNEDGKRLGLAVNPAATRLLFGAERGPFGDLVVGPALLCDPTEID